jgi:hypothetical protein
MKTRISASLFALWPLVSWCAEQEDWNLKLQSTYVWQRKPAIDSPYAGPHSLVRDREKSYSLTATAALGLRLGQTTELYFDPEVAQGVPLSGLQGLGAFTNGEMARSSGPNPTLYRARLFARHIVNSSSEMDEIEPGMNQLGGAYAKRRWVLTAGNLSVLDIFDANAFAHDPRVQFLNWTLMTHGAYDYAADSRGYSWGLAAEYFVEDWTVRFGRFVQPKEPNMLRLDSRIGVHYGDQVELEKRYALGEDRPGALRLLAFRNRAVMSRYDDALARAAVVASVPDINQVRLREQVKGGVGISIEQRVARDAGVFGRAMWGDGKTETYAFTEVDRSASAGVALNGTRWGRGDDVVGIAGALNWISAAHKTILTRGGMTFFLGDGALLHYQPEQLIEAYYSFAATRGASITLDVQRIVNPGYNADRGPASFFGVRFHVEN